MTQIYNKWFTLSPKWLMKFSKDRTSYLGRRARWRWRLSESWWPPRACRSVTAAWHRVVPRPTRDTGHAALLLKTRPLLYKWRDEWATQYLRSPSLWWTRVSHDHPCAAPFVPSSSLSPSQMVPGANTFRFLLPLPSSFTESQKKNPEMLGGKKLGIKDS